VVGLETLGTSEHCIQHGTISDTQDKHFVSSNSTKTTEGRGHWGGDTERVFVCLSVCLSLYNDAVIPPILIINSCEVPC